jgi:hypothetical protein
MLWNVSSSDLTDQKIRLIREVCHPDLDGTCSVVEISYYAQISRAPGHSAWGLPKAEQSPESRALTEFKVHLVHLLSTHGELCQDKVRKIFTAYAILTGGISSSKSRNVQARLLSNLDTGDPESYGHKDSLLLVWPAWGKDKCCRTSSI